MEQFPVDNSSVDDSEALTALNLCTLYSSKKQHLQAKKQAVKAIAKI